MCCILSTLSTKGLSSSLGAGLGLPLTLGNLPCPASDGHIRTQKATEMKDEGNSPGRDTTPGQPPKGQHLAEEQRKGSLQVRLQAAA